MQKHPVDALKMAQAAAAASPNAALGHYALAAALLANNRVSEAQTENNRAGQLDRKNLEGRGIPDAVAIWRYSSTGGRTPLLSSPR